MTQDKWVTVPDSHGESIDSGLQVGQVGQGGFERIRRKKSERVQTSSERKKGVCSAALP